jgi:hypothetical protein
MQALTGLGWILLFLLPPLSLAKWSEWRRSAPILLLVGALVWPLSTLSIKALNLTFFGNPFIGYLWDHPLFLLLEYGIPAFYLYIWKQKRSQN